MPNTIDLANASFEEAPPMYDPWVGDVLQDRYQLVELLGSGGMSMVYLANCLRTHRRVAVKLLRHELAKHPTQRDRFWREAGAMTRVQHRNVVSIYDFGETEEGLAYLVMEYVPGQSLYHELTRRGALQSREAVHIAKHVASALCMIHATGIVHRDLKPDNILLMPNRHPNACEGFCVKVLDFGIAKVLDAPSLTGSQHIFGTPGYIAPEYIQSTRIDGRADFYSLGVILYEMITGTLPFDYKYPADLLAKHVKEMPVPPSQRGQHVHPAVEELVMRCLEKKPIRRHQTAEDLYADLCALETVLKKSEYLPLQDRIIFKPNLKPMVATKPAGMFVDNGFAPWNDETLDERVLSLPTASTDRAVTKSAHEVRNSQRFGRLQTLRRL